MLSWSKNYSGSAARKIEIFSDRKKLPRYDTLSWFVFNHSGRKTIL